MSERRYTVKVSPRSSKNEVVELGKNELKVRLTAPPVDGAANDALREVLAEYFHAKRSQVQIVRGETSRTKIVEITLG
jgi:uncharacterized protein